MSALTRLAVVATILRRMAPAPLVIPTLALSRFRIARPAHAFPTRIAVASLQARQPCQSMFEGARCADIPAERVQGRLEQLPFKSSSFDIVVCAWALETATCTERALCELCRMVRPGGIVCLAFCAEKPALGPGHRAMQLALSLRGSGRFLRLNVIDKILKKRGDFDVRTLPCNGPATALIARRDNLTK